MAPHTENQHGPNAMLPKPLGVARSHNAGKPAGSNAPLFPRGRDLQSAMQHAPTIRVIHIFAPKVIKTDVANFRSTVQKLTGRGKTKSQRRAARASVTAASERCPARDDELGILTTPPDLALPQGGAASASALFWDQQADKEVLTLQRMVGDACGVTDLVRGDSVDSATYSLDSGHTFSGDSTSAGAASSPSMDAGFSFYPQRETPYSLSEIPAPFFGGHAAHAPDMHYAAGSCGLPMPMFGSAGHNALIGLPTSHLMDHHGLSSLGFDVDVGLPLPALSEVACNSPGGSLFDLMPRQHCRLSVQSPYQGANFFEHI